MKLQRGYKKRDLTLKRTYEIVNGELTKYYNNDIQLDEEQIIVGKIEQRTGGVLEDIVETIQESQLDIIEADPRQVCIVQGCVGSGKSTVAIHKLSHIFFNFPGYIRPERSILVAKNQILVGYLSTLFPKLGIFDINYKTLKDLVVNTVFREHLPISTNLDIGEDTKEFDKHRISEVYTRTLEFHDVVEEQINDIFNSNELFETFKSYKYDKNFTSYENVRNIINDLEEELSTQKTYLKDNPNSIRIWLFKENIKTLRSLLTKLRALRDRIKKKYVAELCSDLNLSLSGELNYLETLTYLFVYSELVGFVSTPKYEYCVVDEGQDFSPLEYVVLSKYVLRQRLAIFGDLNQSIETDGLTNWQDIQNVLPRAKNALKFELDTNYRSTKQIIDFANSILKPYTQNYLPKSINRHGENPKTFKFSTYDEMIQDFKQKILAETADLDKSIGIICFNNDTYYNVEQILDESAVPRQNIIKLDPSKPINYIPRGVYLSKFEDCKGLEFSKVFVLDLDIDKIKNYEFAKKAFVAVTRAMNEVEVYCSEK
ncbi:hypothetical protein OAL67_00990 [bacterium]|nr:hypothetical protein [bacterium]